MSEPAGKPRPTPGFRRHKFLDYQGYSFPWYATVMWITFFILGVGYLIRYILLE